MNESLVGLERHEGEKLITEFRFFGWTNPLISQTHLLYLSSYLQM